MNLSLVLMKNVGASRAGAACVLGNMQLDKDIAIRIGTQRSRGAHPCASFGWLHPIRRQDKQQDKKHRLNEL